MRLKGGRMMKFKPVKINQRGSGYQLYFYNPRGERRRISVGSDYQQAQRLAVKFTDWLLEGKDPERELEKAQQKEQEKTITLRDLFGIFMERHGSKQSSSMQCMYHDRYKNIARCPQLSEIFIGDISKRLMLDYMHTRMKQDEVSAATVNREAALIKSMLFRATEWDILERNPLQGLTLFPEAEKRKVNLNPEQAANLISELTETIANIVEFAIYSGFRKENILGLRIESIRFHDLTQTGEVDLIVKGGRKELFPLGTLAIDVLKRAIKDRKDGYVFLNHRTKTRYHSIHKVFNRAVRKLGLTVNGTKFRFHDLRHVFATWLLRGGVSLDAIRELMGHKDRTTTDRYATFDRLEAGQQLSVLPKISINIQKNSLDHGKIKAS